MLSNSGVCCAVCVDTLSLLLVNINSHMGIYESILLCILRYLLNCVNVLWRTRSVLDTKCLSLDSMNTHSKYMEGCRIM